MSCFSELGNSRGQRPGTIQEVALRGLEWITPRGGSPDRGCLVMGAGCTSSEAAVMGDTEERRRGLPDAEIK